MSDLLPPDDPHAPYVQALTEAGDWAALVRYWIAHSLHAPALDRAIEILKDRAENAGPPWPALAEFFENVRLDPFDLEREFPEIDFGGLGPDELFSLASVVSLPRIALNEHGAQFPTEDQDAAFQAGIDTVERILSLDQGVTDPALVAFLRAIQATGLKYIGNLEAARASFVEALAIRRDLAASRSDVYRPDVAMTLNNLGTVQSDLIELEAAQASYDEALATYRDLAITRSDVYRPLVAMTLNNLGNVQRDLIELEAARASFVEALAIRRDLAASRSDVYRPDVAMTLNNLGTVQSALNELNAARGSFVEALAIRRDLAVTRSDVYRPLVATTLNNLGNVQRVLNELEAARASHIEALAIRRDLAASRSDVYRPLVATTLNNLGNVQHALNELEAARASYDEAVESYGTHCQDRPTTFLRERMGVSANLGRLFLKDRPDLGWPVRLQARDAFRRGRDHAEAFRGRLVDERLRGQAQKASQYVYEYLTATCFDLWRYHDDRAALEEAVEVAEASRARRLMEWLSETELRPEEAPPELMEEFFRLRRRLEAARRRFESSAPPDSATAVQGNGGDDPSPQRGGMRGGPNVEPRANSIEQARMVAELEGQYQELLARIRNHAPNYNPDRPVPAIKFPQMRKLLSRDEVLTAIVHYTFMPDRGLAVVMTADETRAVELENFSWNQAVEPANAWSHAYNVTCQKPPDRNGFTGLDLEAWSQEIEGLVAPIAERAVRPVIENAVMDLAQAGIKRLVLVPSGVLHIFPLHACRLSDGRALIDAFDEVVYTPSLSILHRCAEASRTIPADLWTAENPTGDLAYPEVEAALAGRHFARHTRRRGKEADRRTVLNDGRESHVWHYSGHSFFDENDPMGSGLRLADVVLSLREIYTELRIPNATAALLSSCESGRLRPDRIDDYLGLPSGLLYAGATCVVSSLWNVSDFSTLLLMDAFYREWRGNGKSVAGALVLAQRWLRDSTGQELHDRMMEEAFSKCFENPDQRKVWKAFASQLNREEHADRRPFTSPAHWAAFTASGWAVRSSREEGAGGG